METVCCKFCGKELKKDYDLDEHEYYYEPCDCEIVMSIQQYKEAILDLKRQLRDIEHDIWKYENKIEYLENKYTKYR